MTTTDERIKQLLKIIKGQFEDSEKVQAIEELIQVGKKAKLTTSDLVALIENDSLSFNLRAKTIWSLGELGSGSAVPSLLTLIQSADNHHIRILCLEALGKIGKRSEMVFPVLTNLLESERKKNVRQRIPKVLSRYGEEAVPILIEIINTHPPDIKYNALLALGEIQTDSNEVASFLRSRMKNADEADKVGYALALLMQEGKDSEALPILEELKEIGSLTLGQQSALKIILEQKKSKPRALSKDSSFESDLSFTALNRINTVLFKKEFVSYEDFPVKKYADLVKKKETGRIEFKSALRFNKTQQKVLFALEKQIVNTIVGFMNANGGVLLIGVNNDGKIVGLDGDYQSFAKGRQDSDGFRLCLSQLCATNGIKVQVLNLVETFIENITKKEFCIITVLPSSEPVFLKKKQSLFVRMDNSTRLLSANEAITYSLKHFRN